MSKTQSIRFRALILLSLGLLVMGLVSPMLSLTKLILFQHSLSILTGIMELLKSGQFLLFVIIFAFIVMLPMLKISVLFRITASGTQVYGTMQGYLKLMHEYGLTNTQMVNPSWVCVT